MKPARGFSRRHVKYLVPSKECANAPRRVTGVTPGDLKKNIEKTVKRYYTPMNYFTIEGKVFGSNTATNAIAEWERLCGKDAEGKRVIATLNELHG